MHTSTMPRSHEGLTRSVHLAGWVDAEIWGSLA